MVNDQRSDQQPRVAVIGLGYVGLPLASHFVQKGFEVTGIDLSEAKLALLRSGKSYIPEVSDQDLIKAMESGKLRVSSDYELIAAADAIIICLPTPLTEQHQPDLSYLLSAAESVRTRLRQGQLVILESSTYPGTTREIMQCMLQGTSFEAGKDIFIGYSPERIDPGNAQYSVGVIPKIISGITSACLSRVQDLYGQIFAVTASVSSPEIAEMAKLLENSYRYVNISFINELAILCDELNIDVWEVIDAAKTKPFGFSAFYPGPGVGGHCIPVDPIYLQWKVSQLGLESSFIQTADRLNCHMPDYIVRRVGELLMPAKRLNEANILLYGAAYKKDIGDIRESSALVVMKRLKEQGAFVHYHDPYADTLQLDGETICSVPLTEETVRKADCVVILTDHTVMPKQVLLDHADLIFDTRDALRTAVAKAKVVRLGGGMARLEA